MERDTHWMKYQKVYFTQSAHSFFLTLYKPEESNLVVFCGDDGPYRFIREILPDQEIVTIPNVDVSDLPRFALWCDRYRKFFDKIHPKAEIFFFGWPGFIPFFVLYDYLKKKGMNVKYINALYPDWWYESVGDDRFRGKALQLSKISGLPIARFRTRMWPFWGLTEYPPYKEMSVEPWAVLTKKYYRGVGKPSRNAILLLDGPIHALSSVPGGIDIPETQKNLVSFFSVLMQQGKEIHLKPHPGDKHKYNSLQGTELEDKVKVLPRYYLAEMIMNRYREVYGFNSSSMSGPIEGRTFSLGKLIVFASKEVETEFWAVLRDSTEKHSKIEILPFKRGKAKRR